MGPIPTDSSSSIPVTTGASVNVTDTNTQIAGAASSASSDSSMSKVSSMSELQKKSPKVYDAVLQGIATTICNNMKDSQERIKKINDDAKRNS
jgi:hypothetical protein